MTAEEQLQWVTDFEALMQDGGGRIVSEARRRQPQWQPEDAPTVRRLVGLLAAWPFAQDFAEKAQRYGDYMARATRLPVYVDKVMCAIDNLAALYTAQKLPTDFVQDSRLLQTYLR